MVGVGSRAGTLGNDVTTLVAEWKQGGNRWHYSNTLARAIPLDTLERGWTPTAASPIEVLLKSGVVRV